MVDVRDDRDITEFHVLGLGSVAGSRPKALPLSVARLIQGFSQLRKGKRDTKYSSNLKHLRVR
ncbi:msr4113 [Mesorhizobium japonicum MAFF 303099]|uniref:Msr4113 protein n=1 Tax=Mesorhizobium japonicum (strain LMG 29417 / CECT 9101 / MAFF 303099) TaxID=266835 RepID=Q98ER8_RHILO|nr:msr4113 [Mesorhizobium japonicum MAFF 303099]